MRSAAWQATRQGYRRRWRTGRPPIGKVPGYGSLAADQWLLIYDGGCGICRGLSRWGAALDLRRKVVFMPSQAPGLRETTGLSLGDVTDAAWALDPAGGLWGGPLAIAAGADQIVFAGLPLLRTALRLPLVRPVSERAYRLFAANRDRLGAACRLPVAPEPVEPAARWEIERRRDRRRWLGGSPAA